MLNLSSTSALVLLWARQACYQSERARQYLNQLDLDAGRSLYEQCSDVCPYYDEVIKNRKFAVLHLIDTCVAESAEHPQLVIAGAGFDALGIEVKQRYPHVKVFELDRDNMEIKSRLATTLGDDSASGIAFIESNLLNVSDVYRRLCVHGWNSAGPTLLVLEGISYYLPTESIQELVQAIAPRWMIFEFLKHDEDIAADRVEIPRKVFGLISQRCGSPHIRQYSPCQLESLFDHLPVLATYGMKRLEEMRTGTNRFFPTEASGWIEVCLLARQ